MTLLGRLRRRNTDGGSATLPDPALPPRNRGSWDNAALTNVDITEEVKRQLRTQTRPWQK
ncbi:MAG: hypothetical protein ACREN2_12890 [Candidatus Dormibacteria bacterium]